MEGLKESTSFCQRGANLLSKDELEAHLAALVRIENVGVLLGAGASMDSSLGGMTMKKLWSYFEDKYPESRNWLEKRKFVLSSGSPNIEQLFDVLEIALQEWKRQEWHRRLKDLREVVDDLKRAVISASLLKDEWWDKPFLVDSSSAELQSHRLLLQRLTSARQPGQPSPWIFTTNYDLAIEWAAESMGLRVINGFEGLHNRVFSPHSFDLGLRNMLAKGEARFGTYSIYLAKLHGSLTWRLSEDSLTYSELSTSSLWPSIKHFIEKKIANLSFECPVVFPSASKYLQTVGFVLGELLRRFAEFLSKPQTVLITNGYSFSDEHLNQIILRALQNPTMQIVICLPEAKIAEDRIDVSGCSNLMKKIACLNSPQVTIVGGADNAYLSSLVKMMPEPAIYDEQALRIRDTLKELKQGKSTEVPRGVSHEGA